MAGKAAINLDNLTALGAEKLARLVLDASARDSAFKRLVAAALAGAKGPKAAAAVIDRKIGAIERAKGFVEWDRAKTFAADLDMTVKAIVDELGPADPLLAIERLLRFIATHQAVFERIDDFQGRVQDIYETAIDALRPLVASVPEAEREPLPDMIMVALGRETHGYLPMVVSAVAADIPPAALARWDAELAARHAAIPGKSDGSRSWTGEAGVSGLVACRQAIAEARGDLDGFIALEEAKHPNLRNTVDIAERLLAAGRATEALEWVRRTHGRRMGAMSSSGLADGLNVRDPSSNRRVSLEAHILEALGDRAAAQDLRWSSFMTTLDVGMLREHVAHLEDFAEFDVLDRAFDHVSSATAAYSALTFFIEWPKLDRAAKLVVERRAYLGRSSLLCAAPRSPGVGGSTTGGGYNSLSSLAQRHSVARQIRRLRAWREISRSAQRACRGLGRGSRSGHEQARRLCGGTRQDLWTQDRLLVASGRRRISASGRAETEVRRSARRGRHRIVNLAHPSQNWHERRLWPR